MKKILFAAFAALSMIACNKDDATTIIPDIDHTPDGAIVAMRFTDETPTRAFFAEAAAAEAWEKSLSSLSVYVFNAKGDLITLRDFTASELTARTATFALPHATAGTTCDFYAVANLSLTGVTTKSALLAKLETSAADYNGTFAEVSTQAKRSGGFVMTSGVSKAIAEGGTTSVALTLKRTVAKIAVQTSVDASFNSKYSGTLTVTGTKLLRAASQTPIIVPATPTPIRRPRQRHPASITTFSTSSKTELWPKRAASRWRSPRPMTPTGTLRQRPTAWKSSTPFPSRARPGVKSPATATTVWPPTLRVSWGRIAKSACRSPSGKHP